MSFTSASAASSAIVASVRLAVVVDLSLESGDCRHERLHLFHHALVLLGGVSHVVELAMLLSCICCSPMAPAFMAVSASRCMVNRPITSSTRAVAFGNRW